MYNVLICGYMHKKNKETYKIPLWGGGGGGCLAHAGRFHGRMEKLEDLGLRVV